jgi:hypothetical protein
MEHSTLKFDTSYVTGPDGSRLQKKRILLNEPLSNNKRAKTSHITKRVDGSSRLTSTHRTKPTNILEAELGAGSDSDELWDSDYEGDSEDETDDTASETGSESESSEEGREDSDDASTEGATEHGSASECEEGCDCVSGSDEDGCPPEADNNAPHYGYQSEDYSGLEWESDDYDSERMREYEIPRL